ncbi:hypothetical protein HK105_202659 [Polyrhizophydium stewartii]|uniref:Uncharacterized protein n=1 Tax=Polyrhizophydium stewartii TaxID=2732419 RepID=A0ABR4NE39_9FUNG
MQQRMQQDAERAALVASQYALAAQRLPPRDAAERPRVAKAISTPKASDVYNGLSEWLLDGSSSSATKADALPAHAERGEHLLPPTSGSIEAKSSSEAESQHLPAVEQPHLLPPTLLEMHFIDDLDLDVKMPDEMTRLAQQLRQQIQELQVSATTTTTKATTNTTTAETTHDQGEAVWRQYKALTLDTRGLHHVPRGVFTLLLRHAARAELTPSDCVDRIAAIVDDMALCGLAPSEAESELIVWALDRAGALDAALAADVVERSRRWAMLAARAFDEDQRFAGAHVHASARADDVHVDRYPSFTPFLRVLSLALRERRDRAGTVAVLRVQIELLDAFLLMQSRRRGDAALREADPGSRASRSRDGIESDMHQEKQPDQIRGLHAPPDTVVHMFELLHELQAVSACKHVVSALNQAGAQMPERALELAIATLGHWEGEDLTASDREDEASARAAEHDLLQQHEMVIDLLSRIEPSRRTLAMFASAMRLARTPAGSDLAEGVWTLWDEARAVEWALAAHLGTDVAGSAARADVSVDDLHWERITAAVTQRISRRAESAMRGLMAHHALLHAALRRLEAADSDGENALPSSSSSSGASETRSTISAVAAAATTLPARPRVPTFRDPAVHVRFVMLCLSARCYAAAIAWVHAMRDAGIYTPTHVYEALSVVAHNDDVFRMAAKEMRDRRMRVWPDFVDYPGSEDPPLPPLLRRDEMEPDSPWRRWQPVRSGRGRAVRRRQL